MAKPPTSRVDNSTLNGGVRHLAITADGNGRWAIARGLPRSAGHVESQKAFEDTLRSCVEFAIPYLSLHVFSTENWQRPPSEVQAIVSLFENVLSEATTWFMPLGVRFRWAGSEHGLPERLRDLLLSAEDATQDNDQLSLQFCLNYGGRREICEAASSLVADRIGGKGDPRLSVAEGDIARYFYAADVPDVDLYVRTAGERRFSNFLIWQAAYAEIVFTDTLWPDFRRSDLEAAILEFSARRRTFGNVE